MKRAVPAAFVALIFIGVVTLNADYLHSNKPLANRYIITFNDSVARGDVDRVAKELAHEFQGHVIATMSYGMKGFGAVMTEQRARALSHHPSVKLVEEDGEIDISDATSRFDFASARPVSSSTALRPSKLLPLTVPDNCPLNGSYFVCSYSDDTFWHLDLLDNQGPINADHKYAFATTGAGVRAYVVDTGVYGQHSEFLDGNGNSRVETGANMVVDPDIADAVERNDEEPPISLDYSLPNFPCGAWQTPANVSVNVGHGTAVASVLGGNSTGVAKNVTIVPVKVFNCAVPNAQSSKLAVARGLDWIIADMQGRSGRAVVSMSVFFDTVLGQNFVRNDAQMCEDSEGSHTYTNCVSALENEVNNVIGANIPVVVSANNRNDGECRTSPARMGYGNESAFPSTHRTITVGGTMYLKDAAGNYSYQQWTCAATPEGCDAGWVDSITGYGSGSNFGACVSIWAPAWNIHVAGASSANSYRPSGGANSGTSFSAPFTAGVVARLLERDSSLTPDQIWQALVTRANQRWGMPDFDPSAVENHHLVYISPFE